MLPLSQLEIENIFEGLVAVEFCSKELVESAGVTGCLQEIGLHMAKQCHLSDNENFLDVFIQALQYGNITSDSRCLTDIGC